MEDLSCVRDPLSKFMARQPAGQFQIGKLGSWSVSNAIVGKVTGEWNGIKQPLARYSFNKSWGGIWRDCFENACLNSSFNIERSLLLILLENFRSFFLTRLNSLSVVFNIHLRSKFKIIKGLRVYSSDIC